MIKSFYAHPLTYYNGTKFKWTMGRCLKSAKRLDGIKIFYTYNIDGLRTSKTINNVKFNYYWNGDKLTGQTFGGNTMYFRYDGDTPISFEYNGEEYYYVTNLQGDIIAILNDSGECVAEYEYDAWGNCIVTKDTNTIAYTNPLRYRGYYYDSDTDLYYLQSRYYDSNIGRFINADIPEILFESEESMIQNNLFAYCFNNPLNYSDTKGTFALSFLTAVTCLVITVAVAYLGVSFSSTYQKNADKIGNTLADALKTYFQPVITSTAFVVSGFKTLSKSISDSFAKAKKNTKYKSKTEKHHIVAQKDSRANQSRGILALVGISVNSNLNLVDIRTGLHRRLHTNYYYTLVNNILDKACRAGNNSRKKEKNVRKSLNNIKNALKGLSYASPF